MSFSSRSRQANHDSRINLAQNHDHTTSQIHESRRECSQIHEFTPRKTPNHGSRKTISPPPFREMDHFSAIDKS